MLFRNEDRLVTWSTAERPASSLFVPCTRAEEKLHSIKMLRRYEKYIDTFA